MVEQIGRNAAMIALVESSQIKERLIQADGPFAPEYQSDVYRSNNPDLNSFDDDQLLEHAITYGWSEGRLMSRPAMREHFVESIEAQPSVLEIGPFCNPLVICSRGGYGRRGPLP